MMKRNALSPRLRFEIFKRDGFRCVYCGATPVESVLHVDHVRPVADDGDNDPTNLVTACQQCNGGKSCVPLGEKRLGPTRTPEEAKDHAEQILAYLKAEKSVVEAKRAFADEVAAEWERSTGWTVTNQERSFLASSVERYGIANMVEAIHIASAKVKTENRSEALQCFRYLCGIIRRWRETGNCSPFLLPRKVDAPDEEPSAVRQLMYWLGMDEPTCELCGGNKDSDHPSPIRFYELLPRSPDDPVRPSGLVVLCEECRRSQDEAFCGVAAVCADEMVPNPRRTFFEGFARSEGRWIERQRVGAGGQ